VFSPGGHVFLFSLFSSGFGNLAGRSKVIGVLEFFFLEHEIERGGLTTFDKK
jgi:hypothetical protein